MVLRSLVDRLRRPSRDLELPQGYKPEPLNFFRNNGVVSEARARMEEGFPDLLKGDEAQFLAAAFEADDSGELSPLSCFRSRFSSDRQLEVLDTLFSTWPEFHQWQAHFTHLRRSVPLTSRDVSRPQWATTAPARPLTFVFDRESQGELIKAKVRQLSDQGIEYAVSEDEADGTIEVVVYGQRVMTAFYKNMCPFKCTYCTLPGANDTVRDYVKRYGAVSPEQQYAAFSGALAEMRADQERPPVIEVLNDGSWYARMKFLQNLDRDHRGMLTTLFKLIEIRVLAF